MHDSVRIPYSRHLFVHIAVVHKAKAPNLLGDIVAGTLPHQEPVGLLAERTHGMVVLEPVLDGGAPGPAPHAPGRHADEEDRQAVADAVATPRDAVLARRFEAAGPRVLQVLRSLRRVGAGLELAVEDLGGRAAGTLARVDLEVHLGPRLGFGPQPDAAEREEAASGVVFLHFLGRVDLKGEVLLCSEDSMDTLRLVVLGGLFLGGIIFLPVE